jgi:hypothetical protein
MQEGELASCRLQAEAPFFLIEKYTNRIMTQEETQLLLYRNEEPTRTADVASNIITIEELPLNKKMPENLANICQDLIIFETYSLLDARAYMERMSKWQR